MLTDFSKSKLFTVLLTTYYILGLFVSFQDNVALYFVITALCLISLIFFTLFSNLGFKKSIVLTLMFFVGFYRAEISKDINSIGNLHSNNSTIKAKIITSPVIYKKNSKVKFFVLANSIKTDKEIKTKSKILVNLENIPNITSKIHLGDYIKLEGKIRSPDFASNPYQFDYKKYLFNNDCAYVFYGDTLTFKKTGEVKFEGFREDSKYFILRQFENIRNKIIKEHSKNIKSPKLEILGGIVFGNETINPDEDTKEAFRTSGLLHLLAASGLNVALIFGIWWWGANLIKLPYNFSIITGAIFIIFYTFMTGFPPSILRASLMILFVLFGKLIDRNSDSIGLIFFVGLLILLYNPKMIFDIGFELSFVVTFGLIVCVNTIVSKFQDMDDIDQEKFHNKPNFVKQIGFLFSPKSIVSTLSVPLIAQLWVIPLQMHYFNNLAPLSVFANIAVVPFIGILSFIGFISSILALIPKINTFIVSLFDWIANPLLGLLIKISTLFSSFKYSLINTISLNGFQIFGIWGIILLFILNLKNNFKIKKQIFALIFLCLIVGISFLNINSNKLEIVMFDVGEADSFLIKTPQNKYILIDTGRLPYQGISSAQAIINRYLKNKRISNLEIMILTHFDSDHAGGAVDILNNFKVNKTIIQNSDKISEVKSSIEKTLKDKNVNQKYANCNETIYQEKDLTLKTFIHPDKSDNEASIITLLTYKDKNILFMADAGTLAFHRLKQFFPKNIDILKVGHHGAENVLDNDLLNYLNPKYALISVGINKFNHPHPSTIELLNNHNINIISSWNLSFTQITFNDKIEFQHFNKHFKRMENIIFEKEKQTSFEKSSYVQNLIKNNL